MLRHLVLVGTLLATPVALVSCKNGQGDADSSNATKLHDAEQQVDSLRAENSRLRQEVDNLKVTVARIESKETQRAPARDQPLPREKEAMKKSATGGTSFQ